MPRPRFERALLRDLQAFGVRLLAVLRPSDKDGGQEPYRIWVKR